MLAFLGVAYVDEHRQMIKAVVLDIGGVLEITPRTGWEQTWADRLSLTRAQLIARLEPVWPRGEVGTVTLSEVEREIARALTLDEPELRALMRDVWTEYLGTLNDQLAGYFASLRPRYRTGILSNSFVGAREREQVAYGFAAICDVIVYSHEEGVKKPDERAYQIVCDRLGVRPDEMVFLDDVRACVEGARDAGMTAIQFHDNDQAIAELDVRLGLR
jgi:epoxide hydrolase-like predicted phosphatase